MTFSSVDLQSRLEVQDLLSRFCHALDHNMIAEWLALFSADAVIDAPRIGRYSGSDQIATIPGIVKDLGGGAWRHCLHNIYMDRDAVSRDLHVHAYCMVSDWRADGNIVRLWDLDARVGKRRQWKILSLSMRSASGSEPRLAASND